MVRYFGASGIGLSIRYQLGITRSGETSVAISSKADLLYYTKKECVCDLMDQVRGKIDIELIQSTAFSFVTFVNLLIHISSCKHNERNKERREFM